MLPYLYTLRDNGIYAEYNYRSLILAIEDFYEMLPGGRIAAAASVAKDGSGDRLVIFDASNGKELVDRTKLGLYFRPDAPQYNFRSLVFANNKLRIPPMPLKRLDYVARSQRVSNWRFKEATTWRPIYASAFFFDALSGDLVVVHELAHQWTGDLLRLDEWQHIWLNEGFACYAEWLWSEIPVYWTILWENPATLENARNQLSEMISRDRNRAAVVIWSVANETPLSEARLSFLKNLVSHARSLDPGRAPGRRLGRPRQ